MRVKVTLRCSECKQRNYNTMKNKKNDLLQFAAKLTEVSADATPGSYEPVFLLSFCHVETSLLRLVVDGVLSAESAVLLHFETIGVILLVLHGIVVSLLALGASQSDFHAHNGTSLKLPPCITPAMIKFSRRPTTIAAPKLKMGTKI